MKIIVRGGEIGTHVIVGLFKMNKEEKKKLILDFINGPLNQYLIGDISFGKFKEIINEQFDVDFSYSDLYPNFLFNAQLSYPLETEIIHNLKEIKYGK